MQRKIFSQTFDLIGRVDPIGEMRRMGTKLPKAALPNKPKAKPVSPERKVSFADLVRQHQANDDLTVSYPGYSSED